MLASDVLLLHTSEDNKNSRHCLCFFFFKIDLIVGFLRLGCQTTFFENHPCDCCCFFACHAKSPATVFFLRRAPSSLVLVPNHATGCASNSIAFGKAPLREANSHPISQSIGQAKSQLGSRLGGHAGRNTQFGFFFQ